MKHKVLRTATIADSTYTLLKGQLGFLNKEFEIVSVSSDSNLLEEIKLREGVRVKAILIKRKISLFFDLKSLFDLCLFFYKEKPSIVHSITPKAGLLSMIAAKIVGVPIRIHTFTGLIFPTKKGMFQKLLIQMDKILCACATNIYPEGIGVKNDLEKFGITTKPLKVIANGNVNGIDANYFDLTQVDNIDLIKIKNELLIASDDFIFIFVGRLVGDKGINELVSCFDRLSKDSKNVKLLLVGGLETDLDPLQKVTLDTMRTNKQILSVGFQKDVRPYLVLSDCLVFPSYREGFPNVVMQAGAMSLPSIVSDINGCNEIIIEGENGVIIPVKDADAIFDAMQNMMLSHEFRNQLKVNARQMIISRYEQKVVWEALLKEYQLLLQNV